MARIFQHEVDHLNGITIADIGTLVTDEMGVPQGKKESSKDVGDKIIN
jgi:peptide deformylase